MTRKSDNVDWVDVSDRDAIDFTRIMSILEELNYERWITACPGTVEGRTDEERMTVNREYLRQLGY